MKRLPIACAAAALATFAIPSAAQALTWNWSFSTNNNPVSNSASGTFTTAGVAPTPGTTYTITGISGVYSYNGTNYTITGPSTYRGASNTFQWNGPSSPILTDGNGFAFNVDTLGATHLYTSPPGCCGAVNRQYTFWLDGFGPAPTASSLEPAPASSVPGPLPLLGAGAAFGWSRRLRRRVMSSADPSHQAAIVPPQVWS